MDEKDLKEYWDNINFSLKLKKKLINTIIQKENKLLMKNLEVEFMTSMGLDFLA